MAEGETEAMRLESSVFSSEIAFADRDTLLNNDAGVVASGDADGIVLAAVVVVVVRKAVAVSSQAVSFGAGLLTAGLVACAAAALVAGVAVAGRERGSEVLALSSVSASNN